MPQDPTSASAKRFASDLRRIREERGVSIEDLHDETKIPLGLLEAFERTGLFDHPQFNRVYLRSFVRTYAQVVRIAAERAIASLEDALDDRYEGALAVEYLGVEPAVGEAPAEAPGKAKRPVERRRAQKPEEAHEKPEDIIARAEKPEKGAAPAEREAPGTRQPGRTHKKGAKPEAVPEEDTEAGTRQPAGSEKEESEADEPMERPRAFVSTTSVVAEGAEQAAEEEDWTAQSPPPGRMRQGPARKRPVPPDGGSLRLLGFIAAAVVAFGLIIWLVTLLVGGSGLEEGGAGTAADTAAVDSPAVARPATPQPARPVPALGDTMTFYIVAAQGKLDPVRVTVDSDLRRPYWVEQGDSMRFDATERIIVEELLANVRLTLEGIDYPVDRTDQQGRVVITRDSARAFLSRLR